MYNSEIDHLTGEFCNVIEAHFGSLDYAAGYFAAVISKFYDRLPEKDQRSLKASIENTMSIYTDGGPFNDIVEEEN